MELLQDAAKSRGSSLWEAVDALEGRAGQALAGFRTLIGAMREDTGGLSLAERVEPRLIDLAMNGAATVSCDSAVSPSDPSVFKDCSPSADIEAAKAKLAEAGYPNGFTVDLFTAPVCQDLAALTEIYQQQAAKAGITVNIQTVSADGFWTEQWMKESFVMTCWNERLADAAHEVARLGAPVLVVDDRRDVPDVGVDGVAEQEKLHYRNHHDHRKGNAVASELDELLQQHGIAAPPDFDLRFAEFFSRFSLVQSLQ